MALFGLFKRIKNQSFDYKPRFYDPQKERVVEIVSKYSDLETAQSKTELAKSRIRSGLRRRFEGEREIIKESNRKANTRVLVILIILILWFAYIIMKYLPKIVSLLS